ncbi:MAG TPA: endo-1,4-beta-xylanase [Planctomycetaceae bacterium]|nr:endo-1,4-beta-xylanase [Planctomycetaceae bacterium]
MGVMRFLVYPPESVLAWPEVFDGYLSAADGRVFPTEIEVTGNLLACRRSVSDSGRLHVAWPVEGYGRPVISTASLPEREEPYLLLLELARGKIAQLRDQISAWEVGGMTIPEAFQAPYQEASRKFREATALQDQPHRLAELCKQSLARAFEAADIAVKSYAGQRLAARRKRSPQPPAALGCSLGQYLPGSDLGLAFREPFAAAIVPVEWKHVASAAGDAHWDLADAQLEWALANRLFVSGGPLLDLSVDGMPAWLGSWGSDLPNLQSVVCDYVETAVGRYAGRIRHWNVCARANTGGAFGLSEENRLWLVARALEVVRQVDDEVQVMIRVDQPWGEYQGRGSHRLAPLQFVDALLRAGIGLSAVDLEIAIGFRQRGSAPRDLLELSRLLDLWSILGIPLYVTLACPSQPVAADAKATGGIEIEQGRWKREWSEAAQADWIDELIPVLMAKQSIVGIFWMHLSDGVQHEFPHAGLMRPEGTLKPALARFAEHRRSLVKTDSDPSIRSC